MDFTSIEYYILFLPISIIIYFSLSTKEKNYRIISLVTLSYIFFWFASGWYFFLLIISTCTDWFAGKKIYSTDNIKLKKNWLKFSLLVNLGLLATFKYLDFIIASLNFLTLKLPSSPELGTIGLILPVGISFYTFQTISYTIDIYRGKSKPYSSFMDFACYASFFPQLVAGPIVRSGEFLEQIDNPKEFSLTSFRLGITLIIYGLSKKLIVADNLALHVNEIFVPGTPLDNILLVWWGSLCFGIQIYCDFSGYTDIALGSARILGIELPENFKTPYSATSLRDFWRRWHISLSTWLRDYLYIPLGGNRHGHNKMIIALMTTMILGGLWHGASWNFMLWGFIHGILLISNHVISLNKYIITSYLQFPRTMIVLSWLITQFFVFFTWLVFRIEDTSMLIRSMKTFIGIDGYFDFSEFVNTLPEVKILTGFILICFILLHFLSGYIGGGKYWLSRQNPLIWGVICGVSLCLCILLRPSETVDFIYFRF